MKWFKMLWLTSEEREILKKAKEKPESTSVTPPISYPSYQPADSIYREDVTKPYKNIFYSNKNLTVVFRDGTMLSKSGVEFGTFLQVRDAQSIQEIETYMVDKEAHKEPEKVVSTVDTQEERQLIANNLDIFKGRTDFEIKGNQVYLKGVNLAMPAPVAGSFIELLEKKEYDCYGDEDIEDVDEQIDALKMFWLKLALNTIEQSREDLLIFVRKNDVRITRNGNLILYRRIVTKDGADTKFVTFVTQQYYRLKKENQDTRDFAVARVGDDDGLVDLRDYNGETGPEPFINLQVAYLELPNFDTNTFTSAHDRSVEIKLGGIYRIPDNKINLNNGICAAGGLHAAAVDYNYAGFGDMPVVVLVNPSKAITVPRNETGKLRTTEMFVACVNDKPQGIHFDEGALAAFDEEYHDLTLTELEEAAKEKSFKNLSVQDTVPVVSLVDLNAIKNMLKSRIKAI